MSKKPIEKRYISEDEARKRMHAAGRKDAYTVPSREAFKFSEPQQKQKVEVKFKKPRQRTMEDFTKVNRAAYIPINPRTVASCKRYYEAGIAGQECKMVLQQAQQYDRMTGKNRFGIDEKKLSIYSVLPRVVFGLSERNIIYIKNWYSLNDQDRQILSPFFDYRGVAFPGKSGEFINNNLPKGRQEKRMFETFNLIHGLDIEITPEGYVFIPEYQELDPDLKDLLEFYFTPDGYAKMYFQNGFMSRLGVRFREHVPSKIKTRDQLIRIFNRISEKQFTADEAEKFLIEKNPSIKTNISKFDDRLASDVVNRYRVYTKMSNFLNEELSFIGTTSYADEIFNLTENFESESDVLATTFYNKEKFGITIADPFAANSNKMLWYLDNATKAGWIPRDCNKLDYISAHEFAHGLIHVYDLSRDPFIRETEMELLEKGNIMREVSFNAKLNTKEFIADCWSEYVIAESPREPAMIIGDRIMHFLQKKVMLL